ncbi:MAG: OsmC family protein [Planctomycetota bacterium]
MKADSLKQAQATLKEGYKDNGDSALQTLISTGRVDFGNLACDITHPENLNPMGLHPSAGGDGTFVCAVEIMLAGLVGCAGTTMAAVAHAMKLEINSAEITAIGAIDFRGTLAVDREAPVGLTEVKLEFVIDSSAEDDKLDKLVELSKRYCVVHRTLDGDCPNPTAWKRA